jgi:hypothetical protein
VKNERREGGRDCKFCSEINFEIENVENLH